MLGHHLPKGTQVLLLTGHVDIHDTVSNAQKAAASSPAQGREKGETRRETGQWKDDGTAFLPERWLDDQGQFDPKAGPFHAFSLGSRACFGQRLAVSAESSS